jgi:hypothetical protein
MPTVIKPNKTMQFDAEKSHFSSVDDAFRWFLLGSCEAKRLVLQKQLKKVERVEKLIEEAVALGTCGILVYVSSMA